MSDIDELLGDDTGGQEYNIGNEEEDRLLADDEPIKQENHVLETKQSTVKPVATPISALKRKPKPFVPKEEFAIGQPLNKDQCEDFSEDIKLGPDSVEVRSGDGLKDKKGLPKKPGLKNKIQKRKSMIGENRQLQRRIQNFIPRPPFPPPMMRFEVGNGEFKSRGMPPLSMPSPFSRGGPPRPVPPPFAGGGGPRPMPMPPHMGGPRMPPMPMHGPPRPGPPSRGPHMRGPPARGPPGRGGLPSRGPPMRGPPSHGPPMMVSRPIPPPHPLPPQHPHPMLRPPLPPALRGPPFGPPFPALRPPFSFGPPGARGPFGPPHFGPGGPDTRLLRPAKQNKTNAIDKAKIDADKEASKGKKRITKPWIDETMVALMRDRDVQFRKWKSCPNNLEHKKNYSKTRNKINKMITIAKANYLEEL